MSKNSELRQLMQSFAITSTGDWGTDNAAGRELGRRALETMREHGAPFMLGHVAKAMGAGLAPGIAAGFWNAIGEATL